jgi:bifunctional UDP-N-acetylglucosamine pyrophosphorylase/glucosamine-1-phosphate N-acetyltransferase
MDKTMTMPLDVVIMAAGKGTRMKSALPKVLHRLGGKPLLQHVIDTAAQLNARSAVVITGHESLVVQKAIISIAAQALNTPAKAINSLK